MGDAPVVAVTDEAPAEASAFTDDETVAMTWTGFLAGLIAGAKATTWRSRILLGGALFMLFAFVAGMIHSVATGGVETQARAGLEETGPPDDQPR